MISRKKLFVAYFVAIPFIAAFYVYYATDANGVAGQSSLIVGSIVLFLLVYWNLKAFILWKRKKNA